MIDIVNFDDNERSNLVRVHGKNSPVVKPEATITQVNKPPQLGGAALVSINMLSNTKFNRRLNKAASNFIGTNQQKVFLPVTSLQLK